MIDFTGCMELFSNYGGSEKKRKLVYQGENYLVKFPDPVREKKNDLSYMNNQFSEYVGCHIFESIGIPVQETLLGVYQEANGKEKVVVACKDFTSPGCTLREFASLANGMTSIERRIKPAIEDVCAVVEANPMLVEKQEIMDRFWDMFVVDTLISNRDRHLNNWGFLCSDESVAFSPVYDCGSSLHALRADEELEKILMDKTDFKNQCYNVISAYSYGGKRINCAEFFQNPIDPLRAAVLRIVPKIDMEKIADIVAATPYMSDVRKEFLTKSLAMRKELILDKALKRCHTVTFADIFGNNDNLPQAGSAQRYSRRDRESLER